MRDGDHLGSGGQLCFEVLQADVAISVIFDEHYLDSVPFFEL